MWTCQITYLERQEWVFESSITFTALSEIGGGEAVRGKGETKQKNTTKILEKVKQDMLKPELVKILQMY